MATYALRNTREVNYSGVHDLYVDNVRVLCDAAYMLPYRHVLAFGKDDDLYIEEGEGMTNTPQTVKRLREKEQAYQARLGGG